MSKETEDGKPWQTLLRPEEREFYESIEGDINHPDGEVWHLDREGHRINLADWIEARFDPDYVRVAEAEIDGIRVCTSWIGVHMEHPAWGRVVFGTELIDVRPETLRRQADGIERAVEAPKPPGQVERTNVLDLLSPKEGELMSRTAYQELGNAEGGHRVLTLAVSLGLVNPDTPSMLWPLAGVVRKLRIGRGGEG